MLLALIQWLADSTSLGWLRVFDAARRFSRTYCFLYRLGIRPGGNS